MALDFFADIGTHAAKIEMLLSQGRVALSAVTVYELFRGVKTKKHIQQREQFVALCHGCPLDAPVARIAAKIYTDLRESGKLVSNEDILIAATAIHNSVPLLTMNERHFARIDGIRFHS